MAEVRKRPSLPTRSNNCKLVLPKDYNYSDIVNNDINANEIDAILIGVDDLAANMDKLIEILNQNSTIELKFKDYESAMFVDKLLKSRITNKCFLCVDALRIDRSYIDLTALKNINLIIPLDYLMWGVKFNDTVDTYCLVSKTDSNTLAFSSANGNKTLSYDNYIKILNKVEELSKNNILSDKEKVAYVSDYIQSCTQFIEGYESESSKGTFITPDFPEMSIYREKSGLVETVLNHHNGVCMGISNLSTLLLNNPEMNVEVESVFGCGHVWNKVLIDGKYYYFDNTWSITRNENMSDEGLVALSFTKKYLFFGSNTANAIGYHIPSTAFIYGGIISEDDMQKLDYEGQFNYQEKPKYKSFRK